MSRAPFVLLPPSQGKSVGGVRSSRSGSFDSYLAEERNAVRSSLAAMLEVPGSVEALTRLRGPLLERASDGLKRIVSGDAPVLPTWRRYSGVVWTYLDPATLTTAQRRRILVPSALYGLTAGDDPIADYRLTFHDSVDGRGPLAPFWRDALTAALVRVVGHSPVVDLLPAEHRRALDVEQLRLATPVVTVRFESTDGTRAIGHAAKAVKGVLARRLLAEGITALPSFAWDRWRCVFVDESVATVALLEAR